MMHEQPLALGFIGLAIGALAAVSLPRTRREDALMGDARDRLADEAARYGAAQLERAEHALDAHAREGRRAQSGQRGSRQAQAGAREEAGGGGKAENERDANLSAQSA